MKPKFKIVNERSVGSIGNYYGGLSIAEGDDGKFYWSVENYDGDHWDEIPEPLYQALLLYDEGVDFSIITP